MSIEVHCECGQLLRVKEKYAGKTGRCPYCKGYVDVPVPKVSEGDILDMLGVPDPPKPEQTEHHDAPTEAKPKTAQTDYVHQPNALQQGQEHEGSGMSLIGSSVVQTHHKVCPICHARVVYWHAECPECKTLFSGEPDFSGD
jgi:hypothetical protein